MDVFDVSQALYMEKTASRSPEHKHRKMYTSGKTAGSRATDKIDNMTPDKTKRPDQKTRSTPERDVFTQRDSTWVADETRSECANEPCRQKFDLLNRRHHCRLCGDIFCVKCADHHILISSGFEVAAAFPIRVCNTCFDETLAKRADGGGNATLDTSLLPDDMTFASLATERASRVRAAKKNFSMQLSFTDADSVEEGIEEQGLQVPFATPTPALVRERTSKVKISNIPWQAPFCLGDVPYSTSVLFKMNVLDAATTPAMPPRDSFSERKFSERITEFLRMKLPDEEGTADAGESGGGEEESFTPYLCKMDWQGILHDLAETSKKKSLPFYHGGASVEAILELWQEGTFSAKFPDMLDEKDPASSSRVKDKSTVPRAGRQRTGSSRAISDDGEDENEEPVGSDAMKTVVPDMRLKVKVTHRFHWGSIDTTRVVMTVACLLLLFLASVVLYIDSSFSIPIPGIGMC
jgi:hypothetical protein